MPEPNGSPSIQLTESFKALKGAAAKLNAASDELGRSVSALETALKRLNLGIEAWVFIESYTNHDTGEFSSQRIGYAKVGGRWGLTIGTAEGFLQDPDGGQVEIWPFNEAPRALRVSGIDKLPELVAKLCEVADSTTDRIVAQTEQAREFADAANSVAASRK